MIEVYAFKYGTSVVSVTPVMSFDLFDITALRIIQVLELLGLLLCSCLNKQLHKYVQLFVTIMKEGCQRTK